MAKVHPTSVIHSRANIDENVEIGPFCLIEDDVTIGEGTKIHNNVTIFPGARIGKSNTIFPNATIAAIPQDLKFSGEYSELFIGDNNIIRESVSINRGTSASGKTVIGNNNLFMAYSHVAHDCVIGNNCILANSVALGGHVYICLLYTSRCV